jgi:pyruvate,orthophosphate dikinase
MFAIAPADGRAALDAGQKGLLVGKARWIYAVHAAGLPAVPTIAISRAAWNMLQAERDAGGNRLLKTWVAILFRLVARGHEPPPLAIRTSAPRHNSGLMRARLDIPAPTDEVEAIDATRPFARAVDQAFHSYAAEGPIWENPEGQTERDAQIVIVQAMAEGEHIAFDTRDAQTGELGPPARIVEQLGAAAPAARLVAERLDAESGQHMSCLLSVRDGKPYLMSARPFLASAGGELEAAVDRVEHGVWTPHQAVLRTDPARIPQLLHPGLAADDDEAPIAVGLGVSPGAASGEIVFTTEDAARLKARGRHCILVAIETGPADVEGMSAATGILTARGGQNSHAAIIARAQGKPCVSGIRSLQIDISVLTCRIGSMDLHAGDRITIDGTDGAVYPGALKLSEPHIGGAIGKLLDWSDASRTIAVRTNAETLESARTALSFGAEGIGLARSEHMFFTPERLVGLRRMILSENEADRVAALRGLVDFQSSDYAALFEIMVGRPVTVRLFDPPLHEFLPRTEEDIAETAASLGLDVRALRLRLNRLAELNPMLGHRGCRLAITYPEILDMQICALVAGLKQAAKKGARIELEIMVPFVSSPREVSFMREQVFAILEREGVLGDHGLQIAFGTMIELPRAALRAGDIAPFVDFFSFGTNDLTQTTFGISRDDAPIFLNAYLRRGLYDADPFATIDQRGVGELIRIAIERGRAVNPNLVIGICGEHAGDAASIAFFAGLGIDYVSCSPYRVPVARLALAQSQRRAG